MVRPDAQVWRHSVIRMLNAVVLAGVALSSTCLQLLTKGMRDILCYYVPGPLPCLND
jgi:hypothetical protein